MRRAGDMGRAVGFDDEPSLFAVEVDDVRADGLLSSKLLAFELSISQFAP